MPKPRPVTNRDRKAVRELHAAGKTRNDIARAIGRSSSTVTKLARELDLSFDRTATAAATEARKVDLAALRAQLAVDLTQDAIRLRGQMWQPAVVFSFGGKDNTFEQAELPEAPPRDKRNLMLTASTAIDRSLRLAPPADDNGADEARSMVGRLMTGLAALYQEQQTSRPTTSRGR